MEFHDFPKIPRLSREIIITEKIDGTSAQICIATGYNDTPGVIANYVNESTLTNMVMFAGSRTRWITPEDDNFGFAAWAKANAAALFELGEGRHFGEWWGAGIQRKYGQTSKRFSLFNTSRWSESRPACCDVVPELYRGDFSTEVVGAVLERLRTLGSVAAPGFMKPEGVVLFHTAGNFGFKKTLENDEVPKSIVEKQAV